MAIESTAHWRDSARSVKFFMLESEAVFPFVILLVHWSFVTLGVAIAATVFFSILIRYGMNIPVFFRTLRSFIAGKRKYAHPWWSN
jgi:intracellular multiplication protein IcmT